MIACVATHSRRAFVGLRVWCPLQASPSPLRRSYYVLVDGASTGTSDDRILDVKLQGKPSVYSYLTASAKAAVDGAVANNADRAIRAYKKLISQ
jgi:hypothetical protein